MVKLLMSTKRDASQARDDFRFRDADSIDDTVANLPPGLSSTPSSSYSSSSDFPTLTSNSPNLPTAISLDLDFGAVTHKPKSIKGHQPAGALRQHPANPILDDSNAQRLQGTTAGVVAAVSVTVVSLVLLGLVSGLVFYLERRRKLRNGSLYDNTAAKRQVMLSDRFPNNMLTTSEVELRQQRLTKEFDSEKAPGVVEPGAAGSFIPSELTASEHYKTKKAVLINTTAASGDYSVSDRRSVYELQGDDVWQRIESVAQVFELQGREKLVPRAA